ncbi:hypothetical protein QQF64_002865 [Cirrhinus molitorella]|uniref:Uncharacterized protein n=1 Tax=Cirrhinus molitorella TaxID=172907 RepID=A0ABR3MRI8_9TELE
MSVFAWCAACGADSTSCDISLILSFLQELLDKGRSPSTLKVYVAAIAPYHTPIDGQSVALTSVKRMGDLQALSVSPSCLEFGPNDSKVVLKPRRGYVPKVPTTPFRDQIVTLLAVPQSEQDQDLALLCLISGLKLNSWRATALHSLAPTLIKHT